MKKLFLFFIIVVIIVAIVGFRYISYKADYNAIMKENTEFEQYKDKEVYGIDVATVINKAIDKNIRNEIEKDENGLFIKNNSNSITIEIYIQDNETTYRMETFYNAGTEQFVQYYGNIKFKCSKIEYHEKSKRIKYILFEQLETS